MRLQTNYVQVAARHTAFESTLRSSDFTLTTMKLGHALNFSFVSTRNYTHNRYEVLSDSTPSPTVQSLQADSAQSFFPILFSVKSSETGLHLSETQVGCDAAYLDKLLKPIHPFVHRAVACAEAPHAAAQEHQEATCGTLHFISGDSDSLQH